MEFQGDAMRVRNMSAVVAVAAIAIGAAAPVWASARHAHAAAATKALTRPTLSSGILIDVDLIKYATYRVRFKPRDAFDVLPSEDDLAGRAFRFTRPILPDGSEDAPAVWSYDGATQTLKISMNREIFEAADFPDLSLDELAGGPAYFYGLYVGYAFRSAGSYVGENGFGVKRRVDRGVSWGIAVAEYVRESWVESAAAVSLKASPEEARKLATSAVVTVEGVLTPMDGHRVALCGRDVSEPTLNNPSDVTSEFCVYSSRLTRIDVRSGEREIATWTAPKEPSAAPAP